MLSAVIPPERSQPAMPLAEQLAHQRFVRPGPLVLGTALLKTPTRTADRDRTVSRRSKPSSPYRLNGKPPHPVEPPPPPGCDEPTSRCQTIPSIWTLGEDQPVIPRVPFIRSASARPQATAGSLPPTFVPSRRVGLTVKLPCALTLNT